MPTDARRQNLEPMPSYTVWFNTTSAPHDYWYKNTQLKYVKMAPIFFVYEGTGSKFCLWVPVNTMNTAE